MRTQAVGSVVAMETEPNHPDDQANEDDLIDERIMTELAKSAALYSPGIYTVEVLEADMDADLKDRNDRIAGSSTTRESVTYG